MPKKPKRTGPPGVRKSDAMAGALKSRWDTIVELEVHTDDWCIATAPQKAIRALSSA